MMRVEKRMAGDGARKRVVRRRQKALKPVIVGWRSIHPVEGVEDSVKAPGK